MAEIPGQIEPISNERRLTNPIWYEWFVFLSRTVKSLASTVNNFIASVNAPWTPFTPTVTAAASGPPTVTITACRYKRIGNTVFVQYDFTINIINGSTGYLGLTLPVGPNVASAMLAGREIFLSGTMMSGTIFTGSIFCQMYNGTSVFALGAGARVVLSGVYEV